MNLIDELATRQLQLRSDIPDKIRKLLSGSTVIYKFPNTYWMLLQFFADFRFIFVSDRRSCCFNPLLSWPSCFIELPPVHIGLPDWPIRGALSVADSGSDFRMFVFHSRRRFSSIRVRRGEDVPPEHDECVISGWKVRDPVAVQYIGASAEFAVLFKSRNILVWGTEEGGLRRMLIANPTLSLAGFTEFMLHAVVGESPPSSLEEGSRAITGTYFVREDAKVKINKDRRYVCERILCICLHLFTILAGVAMFWAYSIGKSYH